MRLLPTGSGVFAIAAVSLLGALAGDSRDAKSAEPERIEKAVTAAEGYSVEQVASPPLVTHPMFATFDDRGRLFVAESSGGDLYKELATQARRCKIRLLEDRTGDGYFDHAFTFADELAFPMGLAWHDGWLYVADPPKVIALRDTTGDGRADQRREVLGDFGHRTNGSLHGLIFGPDGLLYMTMGMPDGFQLKEDGRTVATGGASGALIRSQPDGRRPEVLCRGFENLVEVAFTPDGAILGTNNWHQQPVGGIRDSLLHLVPGGIYPRHPPTGKPHLFETGEPLPAIQLFPALAISGLVRWRAEAPDADGQHMVLSAQFNTRKVVRHHLRRSGSTFASEESDLLGSESPFFKPSDVLEVADGSLLVIDTGVWYGRHCPATTEHGAVAGGIYRVAREDRPSVCDPWGKLISWNELGPGELVALLEDARPFVADKARETLVRHGDEAAVTSLVESLDNNALSPDTQASLVWALARIGGEKSRRALERSLDAENETGAAAAARGLGLIGSSASRPLLEQQLDVSRPAHVRLAAAEALARCGTRRSLPALWQALTTEGLDRMLEHALIFAIAQVASTKDLRVALNHHAARVQQAALILLDQPPHEALGQEDVHQRITVADTQLRTAALRTLLRHPEWGVRAADLLEDWLQNAADAPSREATADIVLAFQEDGDVQRLVADAIAGRMDTVTSDHRRHLLNQLPRTTLRQVPDTWVEALRDTLTRRPAELLPEAVRATATLRIEELDTLLAELISADGTPIDTQLAALQAIIVRRPALDETTFAILVDALADGSPPIRRLAAAEILARAQPTAEQLHELVETAGADSLIWPTLLPAFGNSDDKLVGLALVQRLNQMLDRGQWSPDEVQLQSILASYPPVVRERAETIYIRDRQRRVAHQQQQLVRFLPLLEGGNARRGRSVFSGERAACIACHRVDGQGGEVGPDLSRIATTRSVSEILQAVVFPNATTAQGYQTYVAATVDGHAVTGILVNSRSNHDVVWEPHRDAILVLRDPSGHEHRLRHDEISRLHRSPVSLMPEGLLQVLSDDEIRDLFAYLQSLR